MNTSYKAGDLIVTIERYRKVAYYVERVFADGSLLCAQAVIDKRANDVVGKSDVTCVIDPAQISVKHA